MKNNAIEPKFKNDSLALYHGECIEVMKTLPDSSVDSIVTDPPYGLGFMGKDWDALPPGKEWAEECFRVLKPGGYILAFGGSRTWHRLAVAIEDGGFEIRDSIAWLYSSGFPKSMDVAKAIDKANGVWRGRAGAVVSENGSMSAANYERTPKGDPVTPEAVQWEGWGTALKPAFEPIVVGRKPLEGTVIANVLKYGTGGINIDASRTGISGGAKDGRFPANVLIDPASAEELGECAKFFPTFRYQSKPGKAERPLDSDGKGHPTVKPIALMQWLVRLVTPPGGTVLEPFAGSGTTVEACLEERFKCIAIEMTADYLPLIKLRVKRYAEKKEQTLF